jgi:imidazolonepropionase-like amidohydrolase
MIDAETADMMDDNDVYLIGTFSPFEKFLYPNETETDRQPAHIRDKMRSYAEKIRAGREAIAKSNIRLGYGSDHVSVRQSYESAYEYAALLRGGITPLRALRAATSVNAAIIGEGNELGRLRPGYVADIAAWPLNLQENPEALFECRFSMKAGKIISLHTR